MELAQRFRLIKYTEREERRYCPTLLSSYIPRQREDGCLLEGILIIFTACYKSQWYCSYSLVVCNTVLLERSKHQSGGLERSLDSMSEKVGFKASL